MNIDIIENIVMLAAAVIALLISLFRYFEAPKRGWLLISFYFMTHLLSDYYWTIYSLVMRESPDVSAFIAYFGWNTSFLVLLITLLHVRKHHTKRYFHPLMLLPIPINLYQHAIYMQYGGIFNNIWQFLTLTAVACICLQRILYHFTHRKEGDPFPYLHTMALIFVATEYGMWTSSCYNWPDNIHNPYYYFAFVSYFVLLTFVWAIGKDYESLGFQYPVKSYSEIRFQVILQSTVSALIFGFCIGGYYLAVRLKEAIPTDNGDAGAYTVIALILFAISVFLVILIAGILFFIALRFRKTTHEQNEMREDRRNRFNLVFTLSITFLLMMFGVIYNSRNLYKNSTNAIYQAGEDAAQTTATELENYLVNARSTLKVVADSVELMILNGETQDTLCRYLVDQTKLQKGHLDSNYTGIYGYIRGEYMDGLEWVPPADYDAQSRDWYKAAVEGGGNVIIIPPYVDAQTKSVVITIAKLLDDDAPEGSYDNRNVVALDVIVDHIQETTEQVDVGGKGHAMIVNKKGLIVAHHNPEYNGSEFTEYYDAQLLDELIRVGDGSIQGMINDGEEATLFVSTVMDQWYVIVVVPNTELFEEINSQLLINILVSLILFALITLFYYFGYMNEQAYGKRVEELNATHQRQEYEAQMLRLEMRTADEANKAKSSFLADMSHEIRTPINAILGMNEMVLREAQDSDIREYARNIDISGRKLLHLINSILDFSKIEDGKMEIVPVRYKVRDLITYLVNSVQERALAKELTFITDIDPTLPSELYGDDARINQVILNLLTNAIKYTPHGSVTLTMKGVDRAAARVLLHVEVSDTGIGIKESDMNRLFQSFARLDEEKNRNIEGTGLGMSITTKLLHLMKSELKVNSVYGKGSTFSFEIWQRIENSSPLGDYRMPEPESADNAYAGESFRAPAARILLVDDTKMNLTVVTSLLKQTQVQIDTACDGESAIELARENVYDLILMDQRMPEMDGTETLAHMREIEGFINADTPVICLTADAIRGARERYLSKGFTDYLTKPVDGHSLENTLLTYLPADKIIRTGDSSASASQAAEAVSEPAPQVVETNSTPAPQAVKANSGSADAPAEHRADEPTFLEALRAAQIDTDAGMSACGDSEEVYREILSVFAGEYEERRAQLDECLEKKDWKNYSTYIHSLKSSAKTIGAMKLSGTAAMLEYAADDEDSLTITTTHGSAMEAYEQIVQIIRNS